MASITKRKSKFAIVYWYLDGNDIRKQKWETCNTKKEAKARKAFIEFYQQTNGLTLVPLSEQYKKELEDAKKELDTPDSDITLSEFLDIFVNIYGVSKWSANTFSSKKSSISNYIKPIIGNWKLSDITTKNLSKYYNDLLSVPEVPRSNRKATGRCVQPANIKKIHDIIRCALNQAILWEYLDTKMRNPASLAILPKMPKKRRAVWTIDTFKKAISVADDDLLLICMHLAFSCSMRIGEITGLTWDDIIIDDQAIEDGNARVIINKELSRVPLEAMQKLKEKDIIKVFPTQKPHATTRLVLKTPKTETSNRVVWLPKTVSLLLRNYKDEQTELKEFLGTAYNNFDLVIALDNGNPVESRIVRDRFQALCEVNDLEMVVFHSLRHLSTGYKLKMTNGDVKSVQGDTGHAEAEMVMDVYSRVIDEDRRLNAKKLDEKFYHSLNESDETVKQTSSTEKDNFVANLMEFMADEKNREQLQQMLNLANN
ncbi:tyrosine-type recombinase/integrase [Enterococcus faecium]|uniref:site-specific integrase n=1 Tax=Enterococcus TaxID=1350 RepID=UPI0008A8DA60|nr:tyrosine-type recombinase/integrase [Enterococcus sp. HMSC072F02]MDB7281297.1 tyrosine-type recombinase/integrase [Enterococcus faecium]MDB7283912.1 tyrosine-type recombinase/integrase [Enterococcus faecium]MDB7289019.1 tyrosine-type recombinase/integrase [Enterococcus faecium]MDB7294104.1 tyrosine-type recombinase/integrase [Enterococcus faecium]MDB7304099.1 tyrosine-type recombinase/integrase [Enterococcus faecium]